MLLGVCILLLAAAALAEHESSVYLAAMAMGMQNGMATTYSGAVVRTTHMTGIVTDIGLLVGRIAGRYVRGWSIQAVEQADLAADVSKLLLLTILLLGYAVGGAVGGAAYHAIGSDALYLSGAMTGLMGLGYLGYRVGVLQKKVWDQEEHDNLEITFDVHQIDGRRPSIVSLTGASEGEQSSPGRVERRLTAHVIPRMTRRSDVDLDESKRRASLQLTQHFSQHPYLIAGP